QAPKKTVQLIFLLTFIALVLTTYKAIFNTPQVANLDELELKEETTKEDSEEILEELDPDDREIDTTETDRLKTDTPRKLEVLEDQ
ncbi:MAG: hypothetical protein WA749_12880, partial [Gelidibacter sp.]